MGCCCGDGWSWDPCLSLDWAVYIHTFLNTRALSLSSSHLQRILTREQWSKPQTASTALSSPLSFLVCQPVVSLVFSAALALAFGIGVMSVRVVARIRPLLEKELDKDVIVHAESPEEGKAPSVVKIPNPKNPSEEFSFAFNGVYDQGVTQEQLFTAEGTLNLPLAAGLSLGNPLTHQIQWLPTSSRSSKVTMLRYLPTVSPAPARPTRCAAV